VVLMNRPHRVCSPQPGLAGWLRAEYPAEPQPMVRRSHQIASPWRAGHAAEPCLPQAPGGVDPPDARLDPFTEAVTEGVARGSCGASVELRRVATGHARQVGPNTPSAHPTHEGSAMSARVRRQRSGTNPPAGLASPHGSRRVALRGARRGRTRPVHTQPLPRLPEPMARAAQLGLLAPALAHQPGLRVRRTLMGRIAAPLAMDVHRGDSRDPPAAWPASPRQSA
jgi:hypothetical protein